MHFKVGRLHQSNHLFCLSMQVYYDGGQEKDEGNGISNQGYAEKNICRG